MPQKVGVIGGTFDPVHIGHLRIAEEAAEMLGLDSLFFIPAALPPHKPGRVITSFEDRWRMLELAVRGHPCFCLSDIERRLPGKSYTVLTLRKLHEELPETRELYFLVGLDSFLELDTWWHYRELPELARLVVLRRPGYHEEKVEAYLKEKLSDLYFFDSLSDCYRHPRLLPVHYLRNTHLGISSTLIRSLTAAGRSIRYLVPDEVMSYIRTKNLYKMDK